MPTDAPRPPERGRIWLGMVTLYLVWGSTYLAIAIGVESIPPFVMAGARFLVAGLVLLGWELARAGRGFVPPTAREWRDSTIVGALLLGGGMGMVAWGEQTIPSGITALLIAMMPVWVAILGRVFLDERLPGLAGVGIVVGFVGVGILVGPTALGAAGALDPAGLVAVMISPLAWATGSLFASHRAVLPRRPLIATGTQMVTGGLVLAAMGLLTGEFVRFDAAAVTQASLAALAYLTIVGSLVAFTTFGWLVRVAPLPLVTTYAYVNPVVAVILGAIVLREPIDARTVVAGTVIVVAVALIITARGRMRAPRGVSADAADRPVSPRPAPSAPPVEPAPSRSASG